MAYTDAATVSNFLQRALTPSEISEIATVIAAVQAWINAKLNSNFDQVGVTTRFYDGGMRNLDIDPCTEISNVEALNDDGSDSYSYTTTIEYMAEPQNDNVKREVRKRLAAFPRGIHRIGVTAKFSEYDGGVPADIQLLATRMVAGVLNAGKSAGQGGTIKRETLEGHEIMYQDITANSGSLEGIALNDPTTASILANRQELYVDNYDRRQDWPGPDDEGGLLL